MSAAPWLDEAVLIALSGDATQRHIGLIIRDDEATPACHFRLHLAWHWDLRWEPFALHAQPGRLILPTGLPAPQQRHLAALCLTLGARITQAAAARQVGYGISTGGEGLDPATLAWRGGPDAPGRTCASYILELIESQGIPILRRDTWPLDRPEDRQWQEQIISILQNTEYLNTANGAAYVAHETQHVGQVARFRPEEVAAGIAAPADERPLPSCCALPRGVLLVEQLLASVV